MHLKSKVIIRMEKMIAVMVVQELKTSFRLTNIFLGVSGLGICRLCEEKKSKLHGQR